MSFQVLSAQLSQGLILTRNLQYIMLVNKQINAEYNEYMLLHSCVVRCYEKADLVQPNNNYISSFAQRTTHLTVIINITELEEAKWNAEKPIAAFTPPLVQLVKHVDNFLSDFLRLKKVNVLWWNDLSNKKSDETTHTWVSTLIDLGLIRRLEL